MDRNRLDSYSAFDYARRYGSTRVPLELFVNTVYIYLTFSSFYLYRHPPPPPPPTSPLHSNIKKQTPSLFSIKKVTNSPHYHPHPHHCYHHRYHHLHLIHRRLPQVPPPPPPPPFPPPTTSSTLPPLPLPLPVRDALRMRMRTRLLRG